MRGSRQARTSFAPISFTLVLGSEDGANYRQSGPERPKEKPPSQKDWVVSLLVREEVSHYLMAQKNTFSYQGQAQPKGNVVGSFYYITNNLIIP